MFNIKTQIASVLGTVAIIGTALKTALVIVTSTGVTVEAADVTYVSNANGYFLTSSFGILQFIPTLAVLAGGKYVLNKIFSFAPGGGAA